jgi:site-specific DNA recombinase
LNDRRLPSPRPQQARPKGWCHSSIRKVLYNDLYRGVIVWNRTKKRDAWGVKHQRSRSDAEWMKSDAAHLRIVTDQEWAVAHERLTASHSTYLRATDGRLWGKPTNGIESKYLLTGLAQCGICGAGLYVGTRGRGRSRSFYYACSTFHNRGGSVCRNDLKIPREDAEWAVVEAVQDEILDPVVVSTALRAALTRRSPTVV